ncbi:transposase [Actinomadura sp. NEAU-AAG7]|uniref:transposase n=1 Tax=Actinomadura sp. NEAU-AAG7 TaxID=2839640 RepID=UPI001BE42F7F|nr:transposase [Actinomadura sp. NEAU-AAG7]MBT2208954.1 transposase [Actinomadura sp. NEAU-AAG7]
MGAAMVVEHLVPDGLWEAFQRVAPPAPTRPQGGGRRRASERDVLAAIVLAATTGCAWRRVPPVFGASWQTIYRWFACWSDSGVWDRLYRAVSEDGGAPEWARFAAEAVLARAKQNTSGDEAANPETVNAAR